MEFKVFLSSRNNDNIVIDGNVGDTLTEVRKFLKEKLENEKFLGKEFFKIKINEDFSYDTSTDSYNACLEEVRDSDFFIAIYNGAAGWAPDGIDMGICHAELDTAYNISTRKTAIIDISEFADIKAKNKKEENLNKSFDKYITDQNTFRNPLKLVKKKRNMKGFTEELLNAIKNIILKHLDDRIKLSNIYYNISTNSKISLNWKKLKYSDRDYNIKTILKNLISLSPDFQEFLYDVFAVPDNLSVSDALAFTGRPFLLDHKLVESLDKTKPDTYGPVHFIGVYGNATELQVKNLIGFPDVSAIRDEFGLYVWEQNTHVQLVFFTDCKTPEAVKSKFLLFNNWCRSNGEYENIINRAKARIHIVKSINEAKSIAGK